MQIIITIDTPGVPSVRHITEVTQEGELSGAVSAAMDQFRKTNSGSSLLDFSTIRIERA